MSFPAPASCTAHAPPALLVQRILACADDGGRCAVAGCGDALAVLEAGAQSCAVLAGCRARSQAGAAPEAGWLVGIASCRIDGDPQGSGEVAVLETGGLGDLVQRQVTVETATGSLTAALQILRRPPSVATVARAAGGPQTSFMAPLASGRAASDAATSRWSVEDPVFAGHFPGDPLVPGAYLLGAAWAQVSAAAGGRLVGMQRVRFRRPLRPGSTIHWAVEQLATGGWTCRARHDGQEMVSARLLVA